MCPHSYNPADFMVEVLSTTMKDGNIDSKPIQRICDAFLTSDACREIDLILNLELCLAEFHQVCIYIYIYIYIYIIILV